MNEDFNKKLAEADETARKFLEACAKSKDVSQLENDEKVQDSYGCALETAGHETEEEKKAIIHFSDFYLNKTELAINGGILQKLFKGKKQLTEKEFNDFVSTVSWVITDAISLDDKNKAAYISKKNEFVSKTREALTKQSVNITSGGCYIATCVYGSYDCPQVMSLRDYRDRVLAETPFGRLFIRVYYSIGPALVSKFGGAAWFKRFWQKFLDWFVRYINANR